MGYNLEGVWLCEELSGGYLETVWLCEELVGVTHRRRKKKDWDEEDEWMFHLVPYKWIRKTQVIPELGVDYNVCGVLLGG